MPKKDFVFVWYESECLECGNHGNILYLHCLIKLCCNFLSDFILLL